MDVAGGLHGWTPALADLSPHNGVWEGWGSVILVTVVVVTVIGFIGVVAVRGMKTGDLMMELDAAGKRDGAYKALAERLDTREEELARQQQQIAAALAELRAKIGSIETMMREVG